MVWKYWENIVEIISNFVEIVLFLIFVICFFVIVYGNCGYSWYRFILNLEDLLKDLFDEVIECVFWDFLSVFFVVCIVYYLSYVKYFINSICSVVIILIFVMYSWYVKKDIFVVLNKINKWVKLKCYFNLVFI